MSQEKKEVLIISLKEEYFKQIIDGKKGFEYRKSFKNVPVQAFIYVTAPVKKIMGVVELGKPIHGRIEDIVNITRQDQPDAARQVFEYLKGQRRNKTHGYALPIESYKEIQPINLHEITRRFPSFQPSPTWIEASSISGLEDFLVNHANNRVIVSRQRQIKPTVQNAINIALQKKREF